MVVVPVVLVGNKKDIRMDGIARVHLYEKNIEPTNNNDGLIMAHKIGAYAYLECSAKMNDGVREVFDMTFKAIFPEGKIICAIENDSSYFTYSSDDILRE